MCGREDSYFYSKHFFCSVCEYYFFSRTPPVNCTTYSLLHASFSFVSGLRSGFFSIRLEAVGHIRLLWLDIIGHDTFETHDTFEKHTKANVLCGWIFFFEIKASCSVISVYYLLALPYFVIWFGLEGTVSSLLRSFWVSSVLSSVSAAPHSLAKLLENLPAVNSIPLSMLLAKMLNNDSPNTSPWGMPVVSGLHLDTKSLATAL